MLNPLRPAKDGRLRTATGVRRSRRGRRGRGPWRSGTRVRARRGESVRRARRARGRGARRAGAPARARGRSRGPTTGNAASRDETRIVESSGVHEPQRWSWCSDHCTFFGRGRPYSRAKRRARADTSMRAGRSDAACARRAPRPPPGRRRATSNSGTKRATGHPPTPPRRACAGGCHERALSPCLHLYPLGATTPVGARTGTSQVVEKHLPLCLSAAFFATRVASSRGYRRRVCAKKILRFGKRNLSAASAQFPLDRKRARSYCADAGSPLRRLRICHPAASERAHERSATRSPCDAACEAAGERRGRPRGHAGVGRRRPRDGPRGDRSCDAAKTTRGLPAPVSHDRYGRSRA